MDDKFYQEIIFALDDYDTKDDMWSDIGKQLSILARTHYIAKIYADDMQDDIISVQFHQQDPEISEGDCIWLPWSVIENIDTNEEDNS